MGIQSFLGIHFVSLYAFLIGTALQLSVIVGKLIHSIRVSVKVFFKGVQAIGLALMFFPVLGSGMSVLLKIYLVLMLWTVFNAATAASKMYEIGKTCSSCEYKAHWGQCPGFKNTLRGLLRAGFLEK
jgi:hypothetical protein